MRALNVLLAVLVSLLIALGVFEVGLRLLGLGPPSTILEFNSRTGWSKKPDLDLVRKTPEGPVRLTTNDKGLADDPVTTTAKPAGTFRVLMLGDSFTQGFTVERKDLFVDELERWWLLEGRQVDVINAGTEAWSTDQEVVWFLDNGKVWQPDVVVLAMYENDLYWNGSPTYEARSSEKPLFRPDGTLEKIDFVNPGPPPLAERVAILRLFRGQKDEYYFQPAGLERQISKEFAPLLNQQPDFLQASLDRTQGALTALAQACRDVGSRLVVVALPSHAAIDPAYAPTLAKQRLGGLPATAWSADRPVDLMLDLARLAGIEDRLDPRPALRVARQGGQSVYFEVDWHLNPAGNRVLARFLHDEFDRRGWFPATHAATTALVELPERPTVEETWKLPNWSYWYVGLVVVLSAFYLGHYPKESKLLAPLKVAAMLAVIFGIVLGAGHLLSFLPAQYARPLGLVAVLVILGFVVYKLGSKLGTIFELFGSFVGRGHWYLMPLVVVLLSIGSLLVVAASSPLVAPFIYTLF